MTDDPAQNEELGAEIRAAMPTPPERDEFWADLESAMQKPGRQDPRLAAKPKRSRRELALIGCLAAGGLVVGGLAASHFDPRGGSNDSCALTAVWQGHHYEGSGENLKFTLGEPLGKATIPACGDGSPGASGPVVVKAYAIKGVSPSKKIAIKEMVGVEFVAARPQPNS